jgi:hypothetical protein
MSLPEDYRDYFIRSLHDALSGHTSGNVTEAVKYVLELLKFLFAVLFACLVIVSSLPRVTRGRISTKHCLFGY